MNLKLWEKEQGSLHPPPPILRLDTTRRLLLLLLHAMSPAMAAHNKMLLNAKSSRANAFQRWRMQRFVSNDDAMGVVQLLLLQHLSFFFFFLPTETNSWPRCKDSPATQNSRITGAAGKSNCQILCTCTIPKPQQQQKQQQQLLKPCRTCRQDFD